MKTFIIVGISLVAVIIAFVIVGHGNNDGKIIDNSSEINYADTNNWLKISEQKHEVDVFYLYPTCWIPTDEDGIVSTIGNVSMREKAPEAYYEQASCFEGIANVFAPFYRQLNAMKTLNYSLEKQEDLIKDVPYHDALAAFKYYIEHYNNGRPFILAGHSQGSNVLKFILSDYMSNHHDVYERMIAAYTLGYSFEGDYFEKNSHLKFAEGETDTQVVISWNCERKENGNFSSNNLVCHEGAMSINPVSWKHNYEKVEAGDQSNLGARDTYERYSAQVMYDENRKYEVLIVGMPEQPANEQDIGEYALHGCDYKLYYYNIRENARKRIESFLNK